MSAWVIIEEAEKKLMYHQNRFITEPGAGLVSDDPNPRLFTTKETE
jgi:hypothetical protein